MKKIFFVMLACIVLNVQASSDNKEFDLAKEAAELLYTIASKGCEHNDGESCYDLANYYYKTKKDRNKSYDYLKKSCDLKFTKACTELGRMHITKHNYETAKLFYKKSCDAGSDEGCRLLYVVYHMLKTINSQTKSE